MDRKRILVVDDEQSIRFGMREYLELRGFHVECASSAAEARARLDAGPFDLLIADLRLADGRPDGGLEVLEHGRARHPEMRVMVLTARDRALEPVALQRGAHCFLQKPQSLERIASLAEVLCAAAPGQAGGGTGRPGTPPVSG